MPDAPLIYIDANVYIDAVTRNEQPNPETGEPRWKIARTLLRAIEEGKAKMAASALLEGEVLVNGDARQRVKRSEKVRADLDRWFKSSSVEWTDIDRFLVRDAVQVAEECTGKKYSNDTGFPGADALHLAAAVRLSCDFLMTWDQGFPIGHTIKGVSVRFPGVVWSETLFDQT